MRGNGTAGEVFRAFLEVGLTSFGGPIAHYGFLRAEFVDRRGWLDDARYAQLLAMCQAVPGPASSQLGFTIGWLRAGFAGACAAFVGFTLPAAVLLVALAGAGAWLTSGAGLAVSHGLAMVAVVAVTHGLWRMARTATPDAPRLAIGAAGTALALWSGTAWTQVAIIGLGALGGRVLLHPARLAEAAPIDAPISRRTALWSAALFAVCCGFALAWPTDTPSVAALAAVFVRAGSLVFGGGHVVLPLLDAALVGGGWMSRETFLAGYGAAQAVPGPMLSLAGYLGASVPAAGPPALGALLALAGMFAPGFLLIVAMLPAWARLSAREDMRAALAGTGAAVVGLLAAAWWNPVLPGGVHDWRDALVVLGGLVLQWRLRAPTLPVVAWCVGGAFAVA